MLDNAPCSSRFRSDVPAGARHANSSSRSPAARVELAYSHAGSKPPLRVLYRRELHLAEGGEGTTWPRSKRTGDPSLHQT